MNWGSLYCISASVISAEESICVYLVSSLCLVHSSHVNAEPCVLLWTLHPVCALYSASLLRGANQTAVAAGRHWWVELVPEALVVFAWKGWGSGWVESVGGALCWVLEELLNLSLAARQKDFIFGSSSDPFNHSMSGLLRNRLKCTV